VLIITVSLITSTLVLMNSELICVLLNEVMLLYFERKEEEVVNDLKFPTESMVKTRISETNRRIMIQGGKSQTQ